MKNRSFDRFGLKAHAIVTHDNQTFEGEVSDMSLKGLFVKTTHLLAIDEKVHVRIYFNGADSKFSFAIPAIVVRKNEVGIGLSFKQIEIESLVLEQYRQACDSECTQSGCELKNGAVQAR